MKKKGYLFTAMMAGAVLLSLNAAPTQAAKVSMPSQGTSYVRKGNTYRLYFKAPVKLTVTTTAKYTIRNTSDWKCIPYPSSKKHTKVFYLRAGHYDLTTTSKKNVKIKTSYKKISKIRKSLETFSYKKYPGTFRNPTKVELNQNVKVLSDMYNTEKYNPGQYYEFTLDKDQKVTMDMTSMPVYENAHTNIFNSNVVNIYPATKYDYDPEQFSFKGKGTHKKYSWNLQKGTYRFTVNGARGRTNFKLTSEDTDAIPAASQITKVTTDNDALNIEYSAADKATGYGIYVVPKSSINNFDTSLLYTYAVMNSEYPSTLSQSTRDHRALINGETYKISVRTMNDTDGKTYGPLSEPMEYTYYVPLAKGDTTVPQTPTIQVSYYDDGGSDEPYIDIDWNLDKTADSYEVAYRLKGSEDWTTFFTHLNSGDEITSPERATGYDFKKGQVYEIRVRAWHSNLKSDWSAVKTTRVTVTPERQNKLIIYERSHF